MTNTWEKFVEGMREKDPTMLDEWQFNLLSTAEDSQTAMPYLLFLMLVELRELNSQTNTVAIHARGIDENVDHIRHDKA